MGQDDDDELFVMQIKHEWLRDGNRGGKDEEEDTTAGGQAGED